MSHKRVLFVTTEFPPQPGGIGNHAYNLVKELSINGFNVTVLTDYRSQDYSAENKFIDDQVFKVVRVKRYKLILLTYLKRIFVYLKLLRRNDIIFASGKFSLWMVGLNIFFNNRKRIAVVHGSEVNFKDFKKKIVDLSLKAFDSIIAVSDYTKSLLDVKLQQKVVVIPNGFQIEVESKKKLFDSKKECFPQLITIGNVTQRKGHQNLIKALPKIKEQYPEVHYHIVGIPTEKQYMQELSDELKVSEHITFHGRVSDEKKYELLEQSDIFVMLSSETGTGDVEGFGIAILEANAMGLPAIGSLNCGIESAISDGRSGRLVNPNDTDDIVKGINDIIKDYEMYSDLSIKWSESFTWDKIILHYKNVINQ